MKARRKSMSPRKATKPTLDQLIRLRADYSLAVLGMGFVRNGSGRFLNIRSAGDRLKVQRTAHPRTGKSS